MQRVVLASIAAAILVIGCSGPRYHFDPEATALGQASDQGDIKTVKKQIEEDHIDPNAASSLSGKYALHIAVERGHIDIVNYLLAHGADPTLDNGFEGNALMVAARAGNLSIAKALLDSGKVPIEDRKMRRSALIDAKSFALVKLLVDEDADVKFLDRWRRGVLSEPIRRRDLESLQYLLSKGAPLPPKVGYMSAAARGGDTRILDVLKRAGGDPNEEIPGYLKFDPATTPIHTASPTGLRWLAKNGADLNRKTGDGNTALHLACLQARPAAVEILLKSGADIRSKDSIGRTPLHILVAGGQYKDPSKTDEEERVLKCLQLLAKFKADFNEVDNSGWTPLFRAASTGKKELVEKLLELGADPGIRDPSGLTAAELAKKFGQSEIASILEAGR